ncbi:DUF2975 domain-containing protein [Maridesulfovibrio salexigens]|uniref:DUF2975 domain-containing protein n=1 Tax=Maridesulfovibrio salexigens (strain ATCC 14822 / DSM 2638 / NCIMB 8403 / VKM B-1763) TaxID=526222 RepID=C6C293_MARSD|nr:DUF2975 domain-containing protein [Maridesulfovibrio salexigens]ACS81294.1 conserved hypothetical protein [Maridesulfovibrio salexigens DSM 2638]
MDKIKKMSIFLKYAFLLVLIAIPVFEFAGWFLFKGDPDAYFIPEFLLTLDSDYLAPLTEGQKILGALASAPYMVLGMFCFWQLVKLFGLYSQGQIFTAENSACYRKAAWALLIGEIVYPFTQTAVTYVATMNNAVGDRLISIGFDDSNLGNIVVACVILAISWVMDEGRKLQDEAELTI